MLKKYDVVWITVESSAGIEEDGHDPHRGNNRRPFLVCSNKYYNRTEFGHWEADTILSPHNGDSKDGLVTFVERKTRVLWSMRIPNRTYQAFAWAMKIFMKHFVKYVRSITTDHGREFSHNYILAMIYHLRFYFCHAHSPQERGTNERFNRKLRARFLKKTDFSKISQNEVFDAVYEINTKPMETLDWKTPIEAFRNELKKTEKLFKTFLTCSEIIKWKFVSNIMLSNYGIFNLKRNCTIILKC